MTVFSDGKSGRRRGRELKTVAAGKRRATCLQPAQSPDDFFSRQRVLASIHQDSQTDDDFAFSAAALQDRAGQFADFGVI